MSKEREATLSELLMREFIDTGYKSGMEDATAHYQPLLDAKDAEIAAANDRAENWKSLGRKYKNTLLAYKREDTTLKALLERARDDLSLLVSNAERGHYSGEAIMDANKTLAAINAATGEK